MVTENVTAEIQPWRGRVGDGTPGPGRPRGVPNRWTRGARAALQMAFDKMGGVDALAQWGRENPDMFYALYARLATSEPPCAVLDVTPTTSVDSLDGR